MLFNELGAKYKETDLDVVGKESLCAVLFRSVSFGSVRPFRSLARDPSDHAKSETHVICIYLTLL